MFKILTKRPGTLVGILLSVGLLGTFWGSLHAPTFIAHEGSILRLPLLSWWRNVPTIFSRDFLMFSDGQFRPLSYALLAVVRTFVGAENVVFWHLWMVAFHALNAILVFVLVRHFSKHVWSAGLSAMIFAFHPLSAVAVHSVDYFYYVLGLSFYLGTLCCYLSYARTLRKKFYVAAMGLFVLGLLTSKVVFTLLLVFTVYEVGYRRSGFRVMLVRLLPFVVCSLLVSPLYLCYKPHPLQYKYIDFPAGAGWYSFFSVVGATGWYAKGLLLGWDLPVVLYEMVEQIFRFYHWRFLLWGMVDLGILVIGGWMLWRKRWAGLGVFLLFGALLPFASTAWNGVEEYVSWVYLYVPLVGCAFLIGGIADAFLISDFGFRISDWADRGKSAIRNPQSAMRWGVCVGGVAILCLIGGYYGVQQVRLNLVSRSAVGYWSRVVQLNPDSKRGTLALGEVHLQRGEKEEALRFLFSPARASLHAPCLVMSRYYSAQGDPLAAAVHLRMARHEESGLQFQTYESTEAEVLYAAGAPEYAEEALGTVLTAHPYNVEAMDRLAEIWVFKGYVTAAYRLLDRATEIAPSHPVVARMRTKLEAQRSMLAAAEAPPIMQPPEPNWLQYVVRGVWDSRLGKEIVQMSERLRSDPVIQMQAGICLVRDGQPRRGLSKLRFTVQSLSSCAYTWAMTCWAASEAGAYREAKDAGLRAQELDPQDPTVHYVLGHLSGILASGSGDVEQAIRHYRQALRLDPRNASTHNSLGTCFLRQGKSDEAIHHFREALRIRPDHAQAHNNLGLALARQDKLDEAIIHFQEALRIRPDYAQAHNNLGVVLVKQEKFDEAITHFQEALRIRPDYTKAQDNLNIGLMGRDPDPSSASRDSQAPPRTRVK